MKTYKNQRGFLLVTAIAIIVIVGFFALAILHLFSTQTAGSINNLKSSQAFYLAESALERGTQELLVNNTPCADINSTFPNPINIANGQTTLRANYYNKDTKLTSSISSTATTIPLTTTTGLAPSGRVLIDSELIDYTGISSNFLIGAIRGRNKTTATSHANGENVHQDLCVLTANAGIPTINPAAASHSVNRSFFKGIESVDRAAGESGKIYRYNGSSWYLEASVGSADIYWITCVNNHDCWAVALGGKIYHYNGSSWSQYQDVGSTNLFGGTCLNAHNCWVVGESGRIYHYTGGSFHLNADVGSYSLAEISCTAANNCWTAGVAGKIYHYNGSSWSYFQDVGSETIYGLTCKNANGCWAVGGSGKIYRYKGSSWYQKADVGSQILYEVTCVNPSDCWAVGELGKIYHYNGSSWSYFQDVGSYTLRFVMCLSSKDCWTVGDSGKIYHYNGSSWSYFQDVGYYDLLGVTTKSIASGTSIFDWKEIVN